jgi:hypothetical protein
MVFERAAFDLLVERSSFFVVNLVLSAVRKGYCSECFNRISDIRFVLDRLWKMVIAADFGWRLVCREGGSARERLTALVPCRVWRRRLGVLSAFTSFFILA